MESEDTGSPHLGSGRNYIRRMHDADSLATLVSNLLQVMEERAEQLAEVADSPSVAAAAREVADRALKSRVAILQLVASTEEPYGIDSPLH